MNTLFCYGDSNTFGYDPRDFYGVPYPDTWCSLFSQATGINTINFGENGRTMPHTPLDFRILHGQLTRHPEADCVFIMLGTNDVLSGKPISLILEQMNHLMNWLKEELPALSPILAAPPEILIPGFTDSARELASAYAEWAGSHGVSFVNPQNWSLPMAFDGVHLSEEGHQLFAQMLAASL